MKDINGLKKVLDVFIASLMAISCVTPVMASSEYEDFEVPATATPSAAAVVTDKVKLRFKCNKPGVLKTNYKESECSCFSARFDFKEVVNDESLISRLEIKAKNLTTGQDVNCEWDRGSYDGYFMMVNANPGNELEVTITLPDSDDEVPAAAAAVTSDDPSARYYEAAAAAATSDDPSARYYEVAAAAATSDDPSARDYEAPAAAAVTSDDPSARYYEVAAAAAAATSDDPSARDCEVPAAAAAVVTDKVKLHFKCNKPGALKTNYKESECSCFNAMFDLEEVVNDKSLISRSEIRIKDLRTGQDTCWQPEMYGGVIHLMSVQPDDELEVTITLPDSDDEVPAAAAVATSDGPSARDCEVPAEAAAVTSDDPSAEDFEVPAAAAVVADKIKLHFKCNVPGALEVDSKEISGYGEVLNFAPGAGIVRNGFDFSIVKNEAGSKCELCNRGITRHEVEVEPHAGVKEVVLNITVSIPNTVAAWQDPDLFPLLIAQQAATGELHIPAGVGLTYTTFDGIAPDTLQRFKTVVFDGDVNIENVTDRQTLYDGQSGIGAFRNFENLENYIVEGRDYKTDEEVKANVRQGEFYSYNGLLCRYSAVYVRSRIRDTYALLSCPRNMKFKDSVFVLPQHIQTIGTYAISNNPHINSVDGRNIMHAMRHAMFNLQNLQSVYTERCYRIDVVNCPNFRMSSSSSSSSSGRF